MKLDNATTFFRIAFLAIAVVGLALSPRPFTARAASSGCTGTDITSISQLQNIGVKATLPLTGTYCLTQNLNASATAAWNGHSGFLPIAGNAYLHFERGFSGTLDGQGHVIRNLTIANSKSYGTGLIAVLQGTVRNLRLVNAHITGRYDVGGIAGDDTGGTIEASSVTGAVQSTQSNGDSVGGVAGYVTNSIISDSFSTAQVTSPSNTWAGGIAGYNIGGRIIHTYSTGPIRGAAGALLGGLLGKEDGVVTGSFWDVTTSKQTHGAGSVLCHCGTIQGLSDSQMKQKSVFSAAGWNFSGVWTMTNGAGYPALGAPIPAPPTAPIPIAVQFSAQVARGATQSISVKTAPDALIVMQVQYRTNGGFKKRGHADAQGAWQHVWIVNAQNAGTATIHLTVTTVASIRHFSKHFQVV